MSSEDVMTSFRPQSSSLCYELENAYVSKRGTNTIKIIIIMKKLVEVVTAVAAGAAKAACPISEQLTVCRSTLLNADTL